MIDGALSRMSLINRTTSPKRLPRLYSARKVPARIPVGAPIRVATRVITTLPKIAFNSPPALPGGGVIWLNRAGVIAATPFDSRVHRTRTSHKRPNPVAATDSVMTRPLAMRRRAYRPICSAPGLFLQLQQHDLGDRQHDKGDDEKYQTERDKRGQVQIAHRLGKFVCQRRRDRRSRLQDRGADAMGVADDK